MTTEQATGDLKYLTEAKARKVKEILRERDKLPYGWEEAVNPVLEDLEWNTNLSPYQIAIYIEEDYWSWFQ